MKSRIWLKVVVLMMVAMLAGFGCAKKKAAMTPGAGEKAAMSAAEMEQKKQAELKAKALSEAKVKITENRIYFDFDKFDLKPKSKEVLKEKAELLKQFGELRLVIEGNCDERGTEEYNLALGERRARAAYEFLVLLGVKASQLEIVSFGEDNPADPGHNETAWAKNRRDEFKIIQ